MPENLLPSTDLDDGGEDEDMVVVSCRNDRIKEREVHVDKLNLFQSFFFLLRLLDIHVLGNKALCEATQNFVRVIMSNVSVIFSPQPCQGERRWVTLQTSSIKTCSHEIKSK